MARKKAEIKSTKQRQREFLKAYSETCSLSAAAKKAGVPRRTHYDWLQKKDYKEAFDIWRQLAGEYLESIAVQRATTGWAEPIMYQGKKCGTVTRYDSGLMQFLLRGLLPEKYATSKTEISGPEGKPVQAKIEVVFVRPDQQS